MGMLPQSRQARRLTAGVALVVIPFFSVMAYRGTEKPWIAAAPPYRQEGPADAKVVIVEFSDFECPACAYAVAPVKQILDLYGPNVRVVFKHFPWSFHRWAKIAALAAECAGKQGKFWQMYEVLYSNQKLWAEARQGDNLMESPNGDQRIESLANSVPLDRNAYTQCLKDPSVAAAIEADSKEGEDHWVRSTPTFFINGKRFIGGNQLRTLGTIEIEHIIRK